MEKEQRIAFPWPGKSAILETMSSHEQYIPITQDYSPAREFARGARDTIPLLLGGPALRHDLRDPGDNRGLEQSSCHRHVRPGFRRFRPVHRRRFDCRGNSGSGHYRNDFYRKPASPALQYNPAAPPEKSSPFSGACPWLSG